jgi:predicted PurR-regulated permease PerM
MWYIIKKLRKVRKSFMFAASLTLLLIGLGLAVGGLVVLGLQANMVPYLAPFQDFGDLFSNIGKGLGQSFQFVFAFGGNSVDGSTKLYDIMLVAFLGLAACFLIWHIIGLAVHKRPRGIAGSVIFVVGFAIAFLLLLIAFCPTFGQGSWQPTDYLDHLGKPHSMLWRCDTANGVYDNVITYIQDGGPGHIEDYTNATAEEIAAYDNSSTSYLLFCLPFGLGALGMIFLLLGYIFSAADMTKKQAVAAAPAPAEEEKPAPTTVIIKDEKPDVTPEAQRKGPAIVQFVHYDNQGQPVNNGQPAASASEDKEVTPEEVKTIVDEELTKAEKDEK